MRSLTCLLALMVGAGCAGEPERAAPWREPGLLHEKTTQEKQAENEKELLKNSQPLPNQAGSAPAAAPAVAPAAAGTAYPTGQPLPSAGYWQ
jgi:hypothetical protein